MKRGAIQEENTALARFRSEENPVGGPGSTAVCTPTILGASEPRIWAISCDNSQARSNSWSETIRSSSEAANGQPTLFRALRRRLPM
jgi:hypothetical protein